MNEMAKDGIRDMAIGIRQSSEWVLACCAGLTWEWVVADQMAALLDGLAWDILCGTVMPFVTYGFVHAVVRDAKAYRNSVPDGSHEHIN